MQRFDRECVAVEVVGTHARAKPIVLLIAQRRLLTMALPIFLVIPFMFTWVVTTIYIRWGEAMCVI